LHETEKGKFHLSNGLRLNIKNHTILEQLFPTIWNRKLVQNAINKYLK
jgi:hypothetical protein